MDYNNINHTIKTTYMTIQIDITGIQNPAAKQSILASFTNAVKAINTFANKELATLEKGKDSFTIEYSANKKVRLTDKALINFITYHLTQLLKNNDKELLKTILNKIEVG